MQNNIPQAFSFLYTPTTVDRWSELSLFKCSEDVDASLEAVEHFVIDRVALEQSLQTGLLLGHVLIALGQHVLHHLGIIMTLSTLSLLCNFFSLVGTLQELPGQCIQCFCPAGCVIQMPGFCSLEPILLAVQEAKEVVQSATQRVSLRGLVSSATREELDGGESADAEPLSELAMCVCINSGNYHLVAVQAECVGNLLVHGSEPLAVSAPGSVEFDQDILVGMHHDVVKVLWRQIHDVGDGLFNTQSRGTLVIQEVDDVLLGSSLVVAVRMMCQ